jgi:hypothetical protein
VQHPLSLGGEVGRGTGGLVGSTSVGQVPQRTGQRSQRRVPSVVFFLHRLFAFFPTHLQFFFKIFLPRLIENFPAWLLQVGAAEAIPKMIASKRANRESFMVENLLLEVENVYLLQSRFVLSECYLVARLINSQFDFVSYSD